MSLFPQFAQTIQARIRREVLLLTERPSKLVQNTCSFMYYRTYPAAGFSSVSRHVVKREHLQTLILYRICGLAQLNPGGFRSLPNFPHRL
ncbi:hypothetical protein [Spirosoma sp.]|uniref:hypothetical protein n=1 Tax=Spirosoma sp. TaxID=1899569 RepID=UPI003B3B24C2